MKRLILNMDKGDGQFQAASFAIFTTGDGIK